MTDFSVPESKKHADGAEVTYEPPSAEEIEAYRADLYLIENFELTELAKKLVAEV